MLTRCWKSILASSALLAACSDVPVEDIAQQQQAIRGDCEEWGCGENTASVDGAAFHELDANGAFNSAGLAVIPGSFRDGNGTPIELKVDRDKLVGRNLINATLRIAKWEPGSSEKKSKLTYYILKIVKIDSIPFWIDPAPVTTYEFLYYSAQEPKPKFRRLCGSSENLEPAWPGMSGKALIFRGDRYKAHEKVVWQNGLNDSWFNIACAGTAPAKMHLVRHTLAASDEFHNTSLQERQAVLKMFTADYCGAGKSFTVNGVPFGFDLPERQNDSHWLNPLYAFAQSQPLEAVWNEHGAVCLNAPRLETPAGSGRTLPGLTSLELFRGAIASECSGVGRSERPPACGPEHIGYVRSAAR